MKRPILREVPGSLGLRKEDGWFGAFTRHQAMGCWANGTRIRKSVSEEGDFTPVGGLGTVLGSIAHKGLACYFVEWDHAPRVAAAVMAQRIERADQ